MNLADTPATWPDPPPMSTLQALLVFGGIPLLIIAVITLLVMAPSLARGPRYRPSQQWDAEAEWFGVAANEGAVGATAVGVSKRGDDPDHRDQDETTGGASASW